jgi:hypothetical protein
MRCGCTTEYDRTDHRHWPDDSECLLPEAVAILRGVQHFLNRPEFFRTHAEIVAFLEKVDAGGKEGDGG